MNIAIQTEDKQMQSIVERVRSGERLTQEDGEFLYHSDDLLTIGQMANEANLKKNGRKVYFIENMSLYFTNVCEAHCAFCNFRKDQGEEGSYTLTGEEMIAYVEQHIHPGVREFHIVGGHNQHVPFQYYVDSLKALHEQYPACDLKSLHSCRNRFFLADKRLSVQRSAPGAYESWLESPDRRRCGDFIRSNTAKKCVWTKPMYRNILRFIARRISWAYEPIQRCCTAPLKHMKTVSSI